VQPCHLHFLRFHQSGQISDLNEAITLYREARLLLPERYQFDALHNLATMLGIRFSKAGQLTDLDEQISLPEAAALPLHFPSTRWLFGLILARGCHYGALKGHLNKNFEDIYFDEDAVYLERNSRDFKRHIRVTDTPSISRGKTTTPVGTRGLTEGTANWVVSEASFP